MSLARPLRALSPLPRAPLAAFRSGRGSAKAFASHWWATFTVASRLGGRAFRLARGARGARADLGLDLVQQRVELRSTAGQLEVVVVRTRQATEAPVVLVNVGCYYSLAETLEKVEGPRYAAQGYGYVLWRAVGGVEEVADRVFERWRADAAAVLDWLGEQSWCDGRVGCHGYSLLGNTSYATLAASLAPDAPSTRPKVKVVVPAISFSRIQPTVFVNGQSLAAELALRFLWLAEVGLRQGRPNGLGYLWGMFSFFGLAEWPGLASALRRPGEADVEMWGRRNELWRGGQSWRLETEEFWQLRDRQLDFSQVQGRAHVHVIAGWNDMFLKQSLHDFVQARRHTDARLTIFTGGHFGVVMEHAGEVAAETGRCYREHLWGELGETRPSVRMQLIGEERQWLHCDAWPPPVTDTLELHLAGEGTTGSLVKEAKSARLSYVYDPQDPTPYAGDGWLNLQKDGPQDQRDVETRDDVLVLTSEVLDSAMDVVGEVRLSLRLSASAEECDVVSRLCVVRARAPPLLSLDPRGLGPGRSVNLCEDILRVQFPKGQAEMTLQMSLGHTCCRFFAGDAVRLQICSAAHPKWLRHPLQPPGEDWLESSEVGLAATIEVLGGALRLPLRSSEVKDL